ncbi:MAG: thrombospondin type 3 repeat-containing protein [Cyclobacteriaceae bacterium]
MMKNLLNKFWMLLIGLLVAVGANAQTDTTMVLDPGTFDPDPTGYYLTGVVKIVNDCDRNNEQRYGGCDDAYGGADHDEYGTQNGWTYGKAIIFHDCSGPGVNQVNACGGKIGSADKYHDSHPDGWDTTEDFLRLAKHTYFDTDSASFGYIISPAFTNLKSLKIASTSDISRQEGNREIVIMVEASFDGGQSWHYVDIVGDAWVEHIVQNQAGDIASFTDGGGSAGFQEIVDGSKEADSTLIRILPIPYIDNIDRHSDGQRLNIWEVVIEAQTVPEPPVDTDMDGITDDLDLCLNTPENETPNSDGCSSSQLDTDNDGVTNNLDQCPGTSTGADVDNLGCAIDQIPLGLENELPNRDIFDIVNGAIVSKNQNELFVFNLSGRLIGKGTSVAVESGGFYIVKNSQGIVKKIYIRK